MIFTAVLLAYANSLSGPFVFDDIPAIRDNLTIRDWHDLGRMLSPPERTTVAGRPLLNASFALSHALGGGALWAHHAINILIHAVAALALLGLVRRTLRLPMLRSRFGADADWMALATAGLWALHPVQTESVTYLVQRAESLMGLWYLLTLYAFVCGLDSARPRVWWGVAVSACALGMATKEVMVSAPLLVLLYDRTFVAGSFHEAWRARRWWHGGLAATWLVLGGLIAQAGGNRGGSIGFGVGIGWWDHALTQFSTITHYLRLTVWPHPLVFEYEPEWVRGLMDYGPPALVVLALLGITLAGLWRNCALGFCGAWFFAILAPTSLLPAPTQLIVEHRLYLCLAALLGWLVPAAYARMGRRGLVALGFVAVVFGTLTMRRNVDYRSELALWEDTVEKRPRNAFAHGSLANALSRVGRLNEALGHDLEAVRLDPANALLHYDLGVLLGKLGRTPEALDAYANAVRLQPGYADAHNNYAVTLAQAGRRDEALREFETTLRLRPDDAEAHDNFGLLLSELGRGPEAIEHFSAALRLRPGHAAACIHWGTTLARLGRFDEALERYQHAVRLAPQDTGARNKTGLLLLALGRGPEAVAILEEALRIKPGDPETVANLALARSRVR